MQMFSLAVQVYPYLSITTVLQLDHGPRMAVVGESCANLTPYGVGAPAAATGFEGFWRLFGGFVAPWSSRWVQLLPNSVVVGYQTTRSLKGKRGNFASSFSFFSGASLILFDLFFVFTLYSSTTVEHFCLSCILWSLEFINVHQSLEARADIWTWIYQRFRKVPHPGSA